MKFALHLDRFEGPKKETAVLLTDDDEQIDLPRGLLPKGVKAGYAHAVPARRGARGEERVARSAWRGPHTCDAR